MKRPRLNKPRASQRKVNAAKRDKEAELLLPLGPRAGFVYCVGSKEYGLYKIGVTRLLYTRTEGIKAGAPFPCETVHYFVAADAIKAEIELHARFAHCHSNGEWFELSKEDINWIKSLTSLEPEG